MADIVSPAVRSRMMSAVRGKDTRPEIIVRQRLHCMGFRYRLHVRQLPGRPDLVFPRRRAVVFVNGCFWHGHSCRRGAKPAANAEFWSQKILENQRRDRKALEDLQGLGWRCLTIWECALYGKGSSLEESLERTAAWLLSDEPVGDIAGIMVRTECETDVHGDGDLTAKSLFTIRSGP